MAGKENQWDLRVEYGWGRRAHRRPCARPHTCTRVHTNVYTHSHVSMHTHASTQIIIIIITLAHAQAIIYSTTSNYICKKTPHEIVVTVHHLSATAYWQHTDCHSTIPKNNNVFDFLYFVYKVDLSFLSESNTLLDVVGKTRQLSALTGFEFLCWTHK